MKAVPVIIAAAIAASASPAFACRALYPPSLHLASYTDVVVAKVSSAEEVASPGWIKWHLKWDAVRVVSGRAQLGPFEKEVSLFSDGCKPQPLPTSGDLWALYLQKEGATYSIDLALPVEWAGRADPRVKTQR